ncbi:MAG: ribosome silencing factor [Candidatus Eisenbacteria bacterium]
MATPTSRPARRGDSLVLARRAVQACLDKKATDPVLLDLRELGAVSDFFIVVSAASEVQVKGVADYVEEKLRQDAGVKPWHIEGLDGRRWVLLDYVDVVVHIFHEKTREYYLLDRLWGDAKRIEVADDRPA